MKKTIILLILISILTSCKKEEVTLVKNKDNALSGLYGHIKTISEYSVSTENNATTRSIKSLKTYDQEGKRIEIKTYANNRINKITRFIYEYGKLIKEEEFNSNGNINTYINYEYEGEHLNLKTTFGKDDVPDSKTEYEYENEKIKTIKIYYFNNSIQKFVLSVLFSYSFREDGQIEKIKKFYSKIGTTEFYSNVSKEIFTCFMNNESKRTSEEEYLYNAEKKDFSLFNYKRKRRFNSKGDEIEYTEISASDIELNTTSLIYKNDSNNNWIKTFIKINGVQVKHYLEREYTFHSHSISVASN